MKNIDVVKAFLNKEVCNTANLHTDGQRLWTYSTVIAEYANIDGKYKIIINKTKYSSTTSHHQGMLLREITDKYDIIETVRSVPRGIQHLTDFIKKNIL